MADAATSGRRVGWTTVAFGDVVQLSKERSGDPKADGIERYVGLEHIDPGDLRVRRWGDVSEGVTFTNVFRPGQLLFGKRRAYQRKVGVADFGGVCSGDIYVLEPKGGHILPELLPFICQSDAFFEHAVGTSAGSLSPRTNWKSLASFEFALPPAGHQREICRVLKAAQASVDTKALAAQRLDAVRSSMCCEVFSDPPADSAVRGAQLIENGLLTLQTGPFGTVLKASAYTDSGHPVINPVHMVDGNLVLTDGPFVSEEDWLRLEKYWMQPGDMVLGRKRHMRNLVFVREQHAGYVVGSDCIRFRVNRDAVLPEYFFHFLRSDTTQHWLQAQAGGNGTVMPGMNERILGRLVVYLPTMELQERIAARFMAIDQARSALLDRISEGRSVSTALLRELLPRV